MFASPVIGVGAARGAAAAVAAGNATGIGVVLPEEVVTAPVGAIVGGVAAAGSKPARLAFKAGMSYDNFLQMSGDLRQTLEGIRGIDGQSLDPDVVVGASVAGGAINTVLENTFEQSLGKLIPGFDKIAKPFSRQGIKQVLKLPGAQQVFKNLGKRITGVAATGGATEVLQGFVNQGLGEISKEVSDSPSRLSRWEMRHCRTPMSEHLRAVHWQPRLQASRRLENTGTGIN